MPSGALCSCNTRRGGRPIAGHPTHSLCADLLRGKSLHKDGRNDPVLIPCCDFLDEFGTEGGQIIGITAGNEAVVDHDFLIGPCTTGVLDIDLQRRVGRQGATLERARLD